MRFDLVCANGCGEILGHYEADYEIAQPFICASCDAILRTNAQTSQTEDASAITDSNPEGT